MRLFLLIFTVLGISLANIRAQILKPVTWDTEYKQINGSEYDLVFKATMKEGWAVYSQFTDDSGPVPTSFTFEEGSHFERIGDVKEIGNRKEGKEPLFDNIIVIKFTGEEVRFVQKVKVLEFGKPIVGYLEFMTCNDEVCLPPAEVDFSFAIEPPLPATNSEIQDRKAGALEEVTTSIAQSSDKKTPSADGKGRPVPDIAATPGSGEQSVDSEDESTDQVPVFQTPLLDKKDGIINPVKWSASLNRINEEEFDLVYKAKIDNGWHIYSPENGEDSDVIITNVYFDDNDHFELIGALKEQSAKREKSYEKVFDQVLVKLKEEATFTQRVRIKDKSQALEGYIEFAACDIKGCLPPDEVPFFVDWEQGKIVLNGELPGNTADAGPVLFNGDEIDQEIASIRTTYAEPLGDCGEEETAKGKNLALTFILGFLGGLLALLTPCVFPMVPLTVSFFTKGSKDRKSGIRNGLLYGVSIILIYVGIGLFITAAFGPTALNALSTNAIANVLFFLIFVFFAFSFFGFYEITLPSSWANRSDRLADKGGFIGIFFMAFTLAIVSFSCTGPIIGSAIVASAQNTVGPAVVMLGFATALALPFGLFAAFPAWLNSLPSSGSWMNSVKVVLGFLELALAFKFLSVADMTSHWGILGYEVFMGLWILISAATALYLFGFVRFPHDSPVEKLSTPRLGFALTFLALTIYLISGFRINEKTKQYHSLGLLSGIAPPAYYNYFRPEMPETQPDPVLKERFPSFGKCANNLDCFKDYYEGVQYAKEVNKPVLLDFTGFGCVNCRKTEEHIWVEDEVWEKLDQDFVLISLYVDDREKLEKTYISKSRKEKIRNVGQRWSDFQIVNFHQNSQPLYVMMTPDEKVLAKPRGYKEGVAEYAEFLDCGLKTFQNVNGKLGSK